MNINDIQEECKDMQAELETIMPSDINDAIERGKNIAAYQHVLDTFLHCQRNLQELKKQQKSEKQ